MKKGSHELHELTRIIFYGTNMKSIAEVTPFNHKLLFN
jgi:hypothetical protein